MGRTGDGLRRLKMQLCLVVELPETKRDELLREIKRTDQEVDNLVYDLYGLTEEERKIVAEVGN